MKGLRRLRLFGAAVFVLAVVLAPFERFFMKAGQSWPYYNWELGFGSIPKKADRWSLKITSVDGVPLNPPMSPAEFVRAHHGSWFATQDYKILYRAASDLRGKPNPKDSKYLRILETMFFRQFGVQKASYTIFHAEVDPLEFRNEKTTTSMTRFMDLEYENQTPSE